MRFFVAALYYYTVLSARSNIVVKSVPDSTRRAFHWLRLVSSSFGLALQVNEDKWHITNDKGMERTINTDRQTEKTPTLNPSYSVSTQHRAICTHICHDACSGVRETAKTAVFSRRVRDTFGRDYFYYRHECVAPWMVELAGVGGWQYFTITAQFFISYTIIVYYIIIFTPDTVFVPNIYFYYSPLFVEATHTHTHK